MLLLSFLPQSQNKGKNDNQFNKNQVFLMLVITCQVYIQLDTGILKIVFDHFVEETPCKIYVHIL